MASKSTYNLDGKACILIPITYESKNEMSMWFSYCSAHTSYDSECLQCQGGNWVEFKLMKDKK